MPDFPTPEDAEAAFYRAFENADLDAMMAIWIDTDAMTCIHPLGPVLRGRAQIRDGWRLIFNSGAAMRFQIGTPHSVQDARLAIHIVHEHVRVAGEQQPRPPIIATNIYQLTERGWRMLLHHASPAPAGAEKKSQRTARVH